MRVVPHDDAVIYEQGQWVKWNTYDGEAEPEEHSRILLKKLDELFAEDIGIEYNARFFVHIGGEELIDNPDIYGLEIINASDGAIKRALFGTHAVSREDFPKEELEWYYARAIDARHAAIIASALLDAIYEFGHEPPVPLSISYDEEKAHYSVELRIPDHDRLIWYVVLDAHGGKLIDMFCVDCVN